MITRNTGEIKTRQPIIYVPLNKCTSNIIINSTLKLWLISFGGWMCSLLFKGLKKKVICICICDCIFLLAFHVCFSYGIFCLLFQKELKISLWHKWNYLFAIAKNIQFIVAVIVKVLFITFEVSGPLISEKCNSIWVLSRCEDLKDFWLKNPTKKKKNSEVCFFTNSRFSGFLPKTLLLFF